MEKVIRNMRGAIWVLAVFVLLGVRGEAQAACGTDTVSKDGRTYGTVVGADGRCWLDRNLGATRVATSISDTSAYGWFIQWGRGIDGHQILTSSTTIGLSGSNTPGHANFIINNSSPYDWRNLKNDDLWQGENGINNPCPTGFRVPTQLEWTSLITAAGITNSATAFSSALKITTAGWRPNTGVNQSGGGLAYYWSNTAVSTQGYYLNINSSQASMNTMYRAVGFPVRCIQNVAFPTVITGASSNITGTSATLNGSVSDMGYFPDATRYIEWGTVSGTYTDSCSVGTGGVGAYSCNLSSLSSSTTYYVRAKSINSAGVAFGTETSFATSAFFCGSDVAIRGGITYGTVVGADGKCWLDRNLGATRVATSYNDSQARGWLFQWGRRDDGHQLLTSGTTSTRSSTDNPSHSNFITVAGGASPYDWRSPQNSSLWQGVNGTNNPCPTGFRVPTRPEWANIKTSAGITSYATAFISSLKLPTTGYRHFNPSTVYQQGDYGAYWSSTPIYNSYYWGGTFEFNTASADATDMDLNATGHSVRCISDIVPLAFSTVATQPATSVTSMTATLNATINSAGSNNPIREIQYGTATGAYTNSCNQGVGGAGAYSCNIIGLSPGTTYYVRAKSTNAAGEVYGLEISFTTPNALASVTTDPISNILTAQATGNANITDIGGGNPMREIQWGTTSGNYTNSCSANAGSTGNYSCQLTGLTPNTTYYLRAMATNSAGTSYGNEVSFQTLPSQVTISEPDTTKMANSVSSNYMSVNSGTIDNTTQITTNTNIIIADGIVKMDIPSNTQITKTDSGNFNFQNFIAESATNIVKQTIPNSISAVKIGVVGTKISFSQPITISIDVDSGYNGRTLDVLYQNDNETDWHSQTSCTITAGKCIFTTNHATTYSVNGSGNMAGETGINLNTDIQEVIALDCGATAINLGNITPGTPITGSSTCTATTNANGGYNLSVRRDDATSTLKKNSENSVTISDLTPWDPTTPNANTWSGNGLGFTVYHSTANKNSAWWGTGTTLTDSNNKYAGFNTAQTDIMRNSTYASSSTSTDIGYMLNVPPTQKSGAYSGSVTYQAVTTP